jgi:hypothetical protein
MIDMGNLKNKWKYLPNCLVGPLKGEGLKDVDGSEGEEDKKISSWKGMSTNLATKK